MSLSTSIISVNNNKTGVKYIIRLLLKSILLAHNSINLKHISITDMKEEEFLNSIEDLTGRVAIVTG